MPFDSHRVTDSFEGIVENATKTANTYFHNAVSTIDERFGEGYAYHHPDLIGKYMDICAQDYSDAVMLIVNQVNCDSRKDIYKEEREERKERDTARSSTSIR